jgi:ABC-type spermidine/putrescine transport system permease subunit I
MRRESCADRAASRSPGALPSGRAARLRFFLLPILILLVASVMPRGAYGGVQPGSPQSTTGVPRSPVPILRYHLALLRVHLTCLCSHTPAFYIARSVSRRNLFLFLAVLPFWTSSLVRIAMIFLLRDSGLINRALMDAG